MKSRWKVVPVVLAAGLLPACAHVKVEPIEVKEIHIVHDVNIHVDKELNDYFAFEEQRSGATQPASTPATQTADTTGDVK